MWILIILVTITMVSSYWFGKNRETPPWVKCKESLFEQVVFNNCTPSSFTSPKDFNNNRQENQKNDGTFPYEPPQN